MRCGEKEDAVHLGHDGREFGVVFSDYVSPFDNQATHGMCDKNNGPATDRLGITLGESQEMKQQILCKVCDVQIGSTSPEVGIIAEGEDPHLVELLVIA